MFSKRSFSTNKRAVGNKGEDLACEFLKKQGYQILARNFTIRGGEIDVVAKQNGILVFVEVKLRVGNQFGTAAESITYWKLKALQKAALFYIQKINWGDKPYRFDLVTIDQNGQEQKINLIKNITG